MSATERDGRQHLDRKYSKRLRTLHRLPSSHIPDRLRDDKDVNEDVTAPSKDAPQQYMNQSVFSMIAAAGSQTDFHTRFEDSSDSEEDGHAAKEVKLQSQPQILPSKVGKESPAKADEDDEHGKPTSHLMKSLRKVSLKRGKSKTAQSVHLPSPVRANSLQAGLSKSIHTQSMHPREAPVLSRILEAEAQLSSSGSISEMSQPTHDELQERQRSGSTPETLLALRLKEIFGFVTPEKVISEYPCWLLQSVLLQGYMYITEEHICFYAYLPKKSNVVSKSGYLAKRGRQNPKYHRYWFQLKGDVLSYYTDPSDLYFPSGNIDLRYGISASMAESKDNSKDQRDFSITTDQRTYHFRADSPSSAKEWVKTAQKVIFRSHNDGDSVKISLPVDNILDIEESPVIDFAETFKVRIIEGAESYAIDEYFFSFFSFGKDAFETLRSLINKPSKQKPSDHVVPPSESENRSRQSVDLSPSSHQSVDPLSKAVTDIRTMPSRAISDTVKATLSPISAEASHTSPRGSGEFRRTRADMSGRSALSSHERSRSSFDQQRRTASPRPFLNPKRPHRSSDKRREPSPESLEQSFIEQPAESSDVLQSGTDTQDSASQILSRSDLFHSPTAPRLHRSHHTSATDSRRVSEETTRSASKIPLHTTNRDDRNQETSTGSYRPGGVAGSLHERGQNTNSSAALHEIVKAGAYPLQRAAGLAEYLKSESKRMSSLLATESMGYYEKVSGMWAGAGKHYGENEGIVPSDAAIDPEDEEEAVGHGDRFRAHFALPPSEKLQATFFGYLHRVLPLYGKIYISNRSFCFRSLLPGTRTKLILPLKDIENVHKEKGFRFGYHGLVIVIRAHEELFFEFNKAISRDDCDVTLLQNIESVKYLRDSGLLAEDLNDAETARIEHRLLQEARQEGHASHEIELPHKGSDESTESSDTPPVLFDDPRVSIINFKPTESLRITCLTIGSRGDVQPYIALCKGFLAEGHKPRIATHAEFEPWIRKHGIDFKPVDGDPAELMRICVENGMFTYAFLKEASSKFRTWIDELLSSAWQACQDSDLLIESPSAMAGIHIAEALGIPYFRAFSMPWTRTRAYPHAFAVPEKKIGGAYNYFSYVMFDNVFWKAIAGQVNRWRKKELGLRSTNLDRMQPNKVPFLYSFSPHVVVPPLDYSDWVRVTGYWFLDEGSEWTPPKELTEFIAKARADGKKLVYIGFGSIVVSDPAALTRTIVESVLKADVRCILSKGWSDRLGDPSAVKIEVPLPPEIHQIKSAPHDWLFRQIDAAAHHGGAGTTGASLRAGVPTIVKPFFGDQFFFGSRVEDLGVGICLKKVNVSVLSRALWEAVNSQRMIVKAKVLGEEIRKEHGVETAIQAIYRDLEYAKTLIKKRAIPATGDDLAKAQLEDDLATIEESWTFIGDESDSELTRRIMDSRKASLADQDLGERGHRALEAVEPTMAPAVFPKRS